MSDFHEVRFPAKLAMGARGGPERKTEIITLASGKEVRNAVWAGSRRRWDVGGAMGGLDQINELSSFFEARRGRLYGFRFRDPFDHSSAAAGEAIAADDQVIGLGDGTTRSFQLRKFYGDVERIISKPVYGTVQVGLDGVEQLAGWSIDYTTGMITFDVPPLINEAVMAGFEFDCPVRFDADRLDGIYETIGAGRVVSIGLVELL